MLVNILRMNWKLSCQQILNWQKIVIFGFICLLVYQKIFKNLGSSDRSTKSLLFENWPFHSGKSLCAANPPNLTGAIDVDLEVESIEAINQRFGHLLKQGGFYAPKNCTARHRVAIVTPFRDRADQLPIFLKNLHSLLMKQQIEYGIFVVEQTPGPQFNRGTLFNVGFVEAMKMRRWDCFIFHDVDLIPLNDHNLYTCPTKNPRHMAVSMNTFEYVLPYDEYFGGATAFTVEQFKKINGHSNLFWGWGGEDDDVFNRVVNANYTIERYPKEISKYIMLSHDVPDSNPDRFNVLHKAKFIYKTNGLNSVKYHLKNLQIKPTYTWILVDLIPEEMGGVSEQRSRIV
ncbi:beta-1,4-N-acetylgalactosaminyltransferase bre-4-like [Contarinia nasturtii]|uniref:beta-1,4-N-acetylgalactosaminyltransferase bre-4-like n=1 Tax=Contarinia nasturtii TaxID=265458 RepID=UPI0012D417D0|nr:beta-1,4-N-acetylgalactosaminyltransferase bre-4-like [Contarinia nasturtii]